MKKILTVVLTACLALGLLSGCGGNAGAERSTESQNPEAEPSSVAASAADELFTDRDMEIGYDEGQCVKIALSDGSSACEDGSVVIDGDILTITAQGSYLISGSLSNGQLIVDSGKTEKIQLIFDGVSISREGGAPLYIKQADKVFLTTAAGSENLLRSTGDFVAIDENNIDAAIFSKDDLSLNGGGSLDIYCEGGHGVVSKDDLVVTSGGYVIDAASHGLSGKDSVRVAGGTFDIACGKDGIHGDNDEDSSLGFVYIAGGEFSIDCGDDGIHASGEATVTSGKIDVLNSYEGIEGRTIEISGGVIGINSSDDGLNAAGGNDGSAFAGVFGGASFDYDESCNILISGGEITINASGDGIDSNGDLTITGGSTLIYGPESGNNSSLDYGGTALISGGVLIATSTGMMAYGLSDSSTQCSISYIFTDTVAAGETVTVADASDGVMIEFAAEKQFRHLVVSLPGLAVGDSYTISAGSLSETVTLNSTTYSSEGMSGMMGGRPSQGGIGGQRPQDGQPPRPEGEAPQSPPEQKSN